MENTFKHKSASPSGKTKKLLASCFKHGHLWTWVFAQKAVSLSHWCIHISLIRRRKKILKKIIILKQGDWAHCKSEMISQIPIWYKTSKPLDSVELCRLKSDEDVVHHIQQLRAHTVLQAYFLNSIIQPMLIKYYGHEKACCYYLYLLCLAHTIYSVLYRKKNPQTIKAIPDPKGLQPKKQASGVKNTLWKQEKGTADSYYACYCLLTMYNHHRKSKFLAGISVRGRW